MGLLVSVLLKHDLPLLLLNFALSIGVISLFKVNEKQVQLQPLFLTMTLRHFNSKNVIDSRSSSLGTPLSNISLSSKKM